MFVSVTRHGIRDYHPLTLIQRTEILRKTEKVTKLLMYRFSQAY